MADVTMPSRALLTETEAINWIAFGSAVDADLTGPASITERWQLDSPDADNNGMLLALRSIANNTPFRPPPPWPGPSDFGPPQIPPSYVELDARARRMVSTRGRSAQELADELQSDLTKFAARRAAYHAAESMLADASVEGRASPVKPPDLAPYSGRRATVVWYRKAHILALRPMPAGDADAAAAPHQAKASPARVKPRGINYREADQPLIEEMHRMLTARPRVARNVWDVALAVSEHAQGHGTGTSKAKRLLDRYSAAFSTERDGKD
jgi:hypothetical protein